MRPMTVFVGPSNTGKSYMAILVYALHKAFAESSSHRLRSMISRRISRRRPTDPPRTGITSQESAPDAFRVPDHAVEEMIGLAEQIVHGAAMEDRSENTRFPVPESVASLIRPLLEDTEDLGALVVEELESCFGIDSHSRLIRRNASRPISTVALSRQVTSSPDSAEKLEYYLLLNQGAQTLTSSVSSNTSLHIEASSDTAFQRAWRWARIALLELDRTRELEIEHRTFSTSRSIWALKDVVTAGILDPLSRVAYYLPADRTGIMHAHRTVVRSLLSRASRAGLRSDDLLPALSGVLADFLEQLIELPDSHSSWPDSETRPFSSIEENVLRGSILSEYSEIRYPEFSYQPDGWQDALPLMNASSMVSELAPVVLYLRHLVEVGDVLIIEEPESHLHPAMQVEFTRQLASAVRAGVRVIITTHSEWVLEELANLVRMSELPEALRTGLKGAQSALDPSEVGAWLFEPKQNPKGSVVKEIRLDVDAGTYPAGFGVVTENLYNDWVEVDSRIQDFRNK